MSVFRDVEIEWGGKSYSVTPSNRLLRKIESEGISLTHMIGRVADGQAPISEVSYVVAEFLKSAGAKVTEDEVYGYIMETMADGDEDGFATLAVAVVEAITPKGLTGKKPDARKSQKGKAKLSD